MKKLTTGQMIDSLEFYETAINQRGWNAGYDHKGNLLMWEGENKPEIREGNDFYVYFPYVKDDMWEIKYHFVDFQTAFVAHTEEMKTIVFHLDEETQYEFVYGEYGDFEQLAEDSIELREFAKGKWSIKY